METASDNGQGTLSIVATPIGNLEDITVRALRVLKECDVVYAEDTRVISKLLTHYEISKPLQRLDAATEDSKAEEIIERLEAGEKVAFVTDAGTPGISDPGARLVARVRQAARPSREASGDVGQLAFTIEAIPGASALTAALSIAGIDASQFTFIGFLPHKKGRQTALQKIGASDIPVVMYESPHRILKLLAELAAHTVTNVIVARELTKMFEELLSGDPLELAKQLEEKNAVRGEFVVIAYTV